MKMYVLAVLACRNSFINVKANHSNIFLACRKKMKKRNQSRVKEKFRTFFTKKLHSKTNVTQRSCTFHDTLTTLSSRCCKVRSFFQRFQQDFSFESFFLTMNNTVTKRHFVVPLRRVKYYKHVKSDLSYNIT